MPYITQEVEVFVDLAEIESIELVDELERRGWVSDDILGQLEIVVQAHRMGLLKIEGKAADILINFIYNKTNKVV